MKWRASYLKNSLNVKNQQKNEIALYISVVDISLFVKTAWIFWLEPLRETLALKGFLIESLKKLENTNGVQKN